MTTWIRCSRKTVYLQLPIRKFSLQLEFSNNLLRPRRNNNVKCAHLLLFKHFQVKQNFRSSKFVNTLGNIPLGKRALSFVSTCNCVSTRNCENTFEPSLRQRGENTRRSSSVMRQLLQSHFSPPRFHFL